MRGVLGSGMAGLALALALALAPLLPQGARAETVRIAGPQGPLEAELHAVEGARHVLVIVPGSGPTDRDGNAAAMGMRSDSYKLLAEALGARGIASLRIDKRGMFGSAAAVADPNDVTIAAYAGDVAGWVARAAREAPCVWIAGHSEGGLVALVAARDAARKGTEEGTERTRDGALCGLVLLAAPGRPVGRLLIEQLEANPANAPLMAEVETLVSALEAGRRAEVDAISPPLRALFAPGLQRFMVDLFAHDPARVAGDVDLPVLLVQGDKDIQVSPERDTARLAEALPGAEALPLEGATHMLKPDVAGQPIATYVTPGLPLHPALVPGIAAFLEAHPPAPPR